MTVFIFWRISLTIIGLIVHVHTQYFFIFPIQYISFFSAFQTASWLACNLLLADCDLFEA